MSINTLHKGDDDDDDDDDNNEFRSHNAWVHLPNNATLSP